jgi:hypothetical protein
MPKVNGLGYGEFTPLKQEHFEKMLALHLAVTKSAQQNWKDRGWPADTDAYWYFDLNAGAGHDPNGLKGSPLIFLEQAQQQGIQYQAVMIERERVNYEQLCSKINDPNVKIEYGDHGQALPRYFVQGLQRFGLVYADPSGDKPPFDLLADMSRQPIYRRLDICIYVHATNRKRERRAPAAKDTRSLLDLMATIDKSNWIVREPFGGEQWSFLIGSNWKGIPDWAKLGFHHWKSARGKEILDILTYTPGERALVNGQMMFPFSSDGNP